MLVCICLYFFKDNKNNFYSSSKDERYKLLIALSSVGLFLMIYKFPLGRYGTSYLAIFIYCIFFPIISFFSNKSSIKKNGKILGIFLIILSTLFLEKISIGLLKIIQLITTNHPGQEYMIIILKFMVQINHKIYQFNLKRLIKIEYLIFIT